MMLTMLHSKMHRLRATKVELHYNGSMGVDKDLLEMVGMIPGQQIDVLNVNNGERFTTYLIEEPRGSRTIGVYGAAAHKVKVGDTLIVIAYAQMNEEEAKTYKPTVLVFDEENRVMGEVHKANQDG